MKKIVLKYPTGTDAASTSFIKEMAPKKKLLKNLKVLIFFWGGATFNVLQIFEHFIFHTNG